MKNFLKERKIKGRYFLAAGLFLMAVFLIMPRHALALPWYLNPLADVFSNLFGRLFKLLLQLSNALLSWMTQLVGWILSNPFNISYTRPGVTPPGNFIIEIGWTLLRDLVNMGFILGLAYIGLATALDLGKGFNTKTTFRNLIIIALLINFTPAICGVVVDAGNILTSFFTQSADFSAINDIFNRQESKLSADWENIFTDKYVLLNTVMLIFFGIGSAMILFLYVLLLLVRAIRIWILVILSPVAFFARIFGKTEKYFSMWWNDFIQWALILPVSLGFFLYLGQQILARTNELMNTAGSSPTGAINQILPYTVSVGFMGAGLVASATSIMPKGGAAILGLAAGAVGVGGAGVKMAANAAGKSIRTVGKGVEAAGKGVEAAGKGVEAAGNAAAQSPTKIGSAVGVALKGVGSGVKMAGYATKSAGNIVARTGGNVGELMEDTGKGAERGIKKIGAGIKNNINPAIEGFRKADPGIKRAAMNNSLPGEEGRLERIAAAIAAVKDGDGLESLNVSDRKGIIQDTIRLAPEQMADIKNIDPELTAKIINEINPSQEHKKQMAVSITPEETAKFSGHKDLMPLAAKIMAEIKPGQINAWTGKILNTAVVSGVVNKFWNGDQVAKAAELFGSKFAGAFRKNIKSQEYYEQNNKALGDFIKSSAGQALAFKFQEDKPRETAEKQPTPPSGEAA
ncbi:MAG: hypothetical protein PHU56_00420 [Candidatus Pacebacteria bacterium]|nr:hypothetical protein [Candidatus Paceibacterota bacterium]